MPKRKLTSADFDVDPSLAELGLKEGDEYDFPEADNVSSQESLNDDPTDTGGDHPTKKPGDP